jgi:alkanesulfonate monooxygenase SsuD/methylene tetrahydromethanopterin reductase-like flavin-dependent oxidoreductase (luciferase family)
MKPSLSLKRIGIWTGAFEPQPARKVQETVAKLEELGCGAVWFSEAFGRETFTQSALLLVGSTRIVVANGIANIYARDPFTMASGQKTLSNRCEGSIWANGCCPVAISYSTDPAA